MSRFGFFDVVFSRPTQAFVYETLLRPLGKRLATLEQAAKLGNEHTRAACDVLNTCTDTIKHILSGVSVQNNVAQKAGAGAHEADKNSGVTSSFF